MLTVRVSEHVFHVGKLALLRDQSRGSQFSYSSGSCVGWLLVYNLLGDMGSVVLGHGKPKSAWSEAGCSFGEIAES